MKPPRSLHVSIHGRNKGMFSVWLKRQAFWFYSSLLLQLRWVIMWRKERVKPLTGKAAPRLWKYLVCAEATKRLQHLNLSHFEFDFSDTEFPDLEDQHQEKVFINVTEPSEQVWKSSSLEIHYLFFFWFVKRKFLMELQGNFQYSSWTEHSGTGVTRSKDSEWRRRRETEAERWFSSCFLPSVENGFHAPSDRDSTKSFISPTCEPVWL